MTMIIGIASEVAILHFSEPQELAKSMRLHESLVAAGQNRIRPLR